MYFLQFFSFRAIPKIIGLFHVDVMKFLSNFLTTIEKLSHACCISTQFTDC